MSLSSLSRTAYQEEKRKSNYLKMLGQVRDMETCKSSGLLFYFKCAWLVMH